MLIQIMTIPVLIRMLPSNRDRENHRLAITIPMSLFLAGVMKMLMVKWK
jgi:hypothetical protein